MGAVIGWPVYTTCMVLTSNLVGIIQGEWSSASRVARQWMGGGICIMVVAIFTIGMTDKQALVWVGLVTLGGGAVLMGLGWGGALCEDDPTLWDGVRQEDTPP